VTAQRVFNVCFCTIILAPLLLGQESFQWDWRHSEALTSKQTLSRAKIDNAGRDAIARAIAVQLQPSMGGLGGLTGPELEQTALDTPVKFVDLNGDGTAEVIAQGSTEEGCSPTGNCPFWIFQKAGQEYKLLLSQNSVEAFNIEKNRSDGFSDIVAKTHGSATDSTVRLWKYHQGTYREAACYDANWSVPGGATGRELKEPRLTPCAEK
jgi:hypothetical protein